MSLTFNAFLLDFYRRSVYFLTECNGELLHFWLPRISLYKRWVFANAHAHFLPYIYIYRKSMIGARNLYIQKFQSRSDWPPTESRDWNQVKALGKDGEQSL